MLSAILIQSVLLPGAIAKTPMQPSRSVIVGAIRWDGWWRGNPWENNLQDEKWSSRLPFYAKKDEATGRVTVVSDTAEAMEREIDEAARGGLDYWAFCYYHPDSWPEADRYNYGWRRYLAAPNRRKMKFALLLQAGSHLGPKEKWSETCRFFAAMAARPEYAKTIDGRPVFYCFTVEGFTTQFGDDEGIKAALKQLKAAFRAARLNPPYLAAQVFDSQLGRRAVEKWGFDAISAYSAPAGGPHGEQTFGQLARANDDYRAAFVQTGHPVIPLVNAGWDGRPRLHDPSLAKHYQGTWHQQPAPEELAAHVASSRAWVAANPKLAPSGHLLIYAWNETDEGGWLVPTIAEGSARLNALRGVLRPR